MFEDPGVRVVLGAFLALTIVVLSVLGAAFWAMGARRRVMTGMAIMAAFLIVWYSIAPSGFLWPFL